MDDFFDPKRMIDGLRQRAEQVAERIADAVRPHAPVYQPRGDDPRVGGALQQGLTGSVVSENEDGVTLGVVSDQSYAGFVVHGTQPHTIEAVNAKFLRFWDEGGDIVFRKIVQHPGTAPNPFFHQADDDIREIIREEVGEAFKQAMHG